jgi:hypothetical protein
VRDRSRRYDVVMRNGHGLALATVAARRLQCGAVPRTTSGASTKREASYSLEDAQPHGRYSLSFSPTPRLSRKQASRHPT